MIIAKCDICGKIKKERDDNWLGGWLHGLSNIGHFNFCEKCGSGLEKLIEKYLNSHKKHGRKRVFKTIR